ncbi:MAG: dTDP-4-dehydrorhamnose 3,5-epimerase [Gemmatimonadaceae bacterium]|nr:dTDP-4-dehydrorhamnose 3,5-epimerase [Gemmatimonadaceae bacterium]
MNVTPLAIPDLLLLEPRSFGDARGFFVETWKDASIGGLPTLPTFVQDNHSRSVRGTLRGLHYQLTHAQGKLVRCARGRIWDVAVDLRRASPTFGRWCGVELDDESHRQLWVPPGFAHGFLVLSERADVIYKVTDRYDPTGERSVRWNCPSLAIDWPERDPAALVLSPKDAAAPGLADAETYP